MIYVNLEKLDKLQGGLSDTAYAKELGISRSQYWRVKHGNSAVGADFIEKFMVKYPDLSVHDCFFCFDCATHSTASRKEHTKDG